MYEEQLSLKLLGPPEIYLGKKLLSFPTRKTAALLIYLAVEGGQQPRDLLAAWLWPESTTERSYASLRNTLGHLQTSLRPVGHETSPYLLVTHNALALNPDANIDLDLHIVKRAYSLSHTDRASREMATTTASLPDLEVVTATHRGDFLAGFSLGDAPEFDEWATVQREVWRRRLGLIFDRLSEIQFARGDLDRAAETASLWISLDTLNEVAYRRKMRAHFAAGERGQALETYTTCRAILAAELGIEPEPDTEALAHRIRSQHVPQDAVPLPQRLDTPVKFIENLFAGRALEHQALAGYYERAASGQPQFVMLRGELGIGKTRLARTFMSWAVSQGADVLEGRVFESGRRMSYQPLIEAFRPLIEQADSPLGMVNQTWLAPLSHLLPELKMHYPEQLSTYLEVNGGRTQLFESLVQLTLAVAHRLPLVLFIDDLQWADSATLDWLIYSARQWRESGARILLVVSLRSSALQPPVQPNMPNLIEWLQHMEREIVPEHLELGPLTEHEIVPMLLSIFTPTAADFAKWMFHETQGHPFYLMETLKDLLERRVLHPKKQAEGLFVFEVDVEHDLGNMIRVPSTVRTVILARLNRLSPNALVLLQAGAILDQGITFDRLCAISNVSEDTGLPALDELLSGRLLLETKQAVAASAYTFDHHITRELVYTEAGDARRRLFHHRALDTLSTNGESVAVLAYHALAAGMLEVAFQYSFAAGQEALRLSASNEAIAHFEKARQLAKEGLLAETAFAPDVRELYGLLAQVYESSGNHKQALQIKNDLEQLGQQPP